VKSRRVKSSLKKLAEIALDMKAGNNLVVKLTRIFPEISDNGDYTIKQLMVFSLISKALKGDIEIKALIAEEDTDELSKLDLLIKELSAGAEK
jgi:hypothetical protein